MQAKTDTVGYKEKLKGGDEYDAFTGLKKFLKWRPSERKKAKTQYNRRVRRNTKQHLKFDGELM
jgi:hypothetical protein